MVSLRKKNEIFSERNYMNGVLLYYVHLCQSGRDMGNFTRVHKRLVWCTPCVERVPCDTLDVNVCVVLSFFFPQ